MFKLFKNICFDHGGLFFVALFLIGFSQSVLADEKPITVGFSYSKAPFVFASTPFKDADYSTQSGRNGIEIDIIREALAVTGRRFEVKYMTYNRLSAQLKAKRISVVATVRPEVEGAFYSDTFVYFKNAVITHAGFARDLMKIEDLSSVTSLAWQGARFDLGDSFKNAVDASSMYQEIPDQKKQVALFLSRRVDAIVIDEHIFLYWARVIEKKGRADFKFHNVFPERTNFVAGFLDEKLRDDFNKGLRSIKANGVYDRIYQSYIK